MVEPATAWDVVILGGINSDYVVRGRELPGPSMSLDGDVFLATGGGKGANAAVAAARLGARTALIGCVGNDDRGRAHIAALAAEGVHAVHVTVDNDAPTGAAVIQVDERGRKQIVAALGANLRLRVQHVQAVAETIRSSRVLLMQLEVPVKCVAAAARLAHEARVRIVLDPAPPRRLSDDLLAQVEVIRANATEVRALTGVAIRDMASARDGRERFLHAGPEWRSSRFKKATSSCATLAKSGYRSYP